MSLNNSGLLANLFGSKTSEAQGAPAGRVFGTRSEARTDFAAFLKAELKGRVTVVAGPPVQAADFKAWAQDEAGDFTEYQPAVSAGSEFEESASELEPEAGPEAAAPGLEEIFQPWPEEASFPAPVEMPAPAAGFSENPLFESVREAVPESQPASIGRSKAGNEAVNKAAERAELSAEPEAESPRLSPDPGPALTSGLEKNYEPAATVRPELAPTAPASTVLASTATASTVLASTAPESPAPRPLFTAAPRPTVRPASAAPASPTPASPTPAPPTLASGDEGGEGAFPAPSEERALSPGSFGRPASLFGAALTSGKYTSQTPEARPAPASSPALAPSAGGDEEGFLAPSEIKLEALSPRLSGTFEPSAESAARSARPEPLLRPGFEKFESPAWAASPRLAPTVLDPTIPTPTASVPTIPASVVSAPSAGNGEAAPPSAAGHHRPAALERRGPAEPGVSTLQAALSSLMTSAEERPEPASAPAGPGPRLAATLDQGRKVRPGSGDWTSLAGGLLARGRLNLASGQITAPALGPGETADKAALTEALDRARQYWPAPFRKQVGLGLVALGRPGRSANSMTAGAALLGSSSPGEVLQNVLSGLKGELKVLKLPPRARDDLGRILAGSGLDQARLDRVMAGFGRDGLSLEALNKQLSGADLRGRGQGLIATEAGLTELARFLGSLGASTEVIDHALNSVKPGQPMTGEVLRDIFRRTEVGGLARNLGPGDIKSLAAFLREMGAGQEALEKLENRLWQTSGQMPLESFLDFLDGLKETPAEAVTSKDMEKVKSLLEQVSRDDGLARPPVFNEILIKLRALGDAEIDDDFVNLSPALQALRGGISGSEDFAGEQFRGQDRENRENQERYRQAVQALGTGQDGPAGASIVAEAEGYGGRSETLTRQIAQKIVFSRRRGLHRLKMNLEPAELGRLDIELSVKDGVLTASIRAENRAAYEALGDRVAELKKALAEGGVELAGLTLAHDDAESGHTFTAGLSELAEKKAARPQAAERPGEVHYLV